ncbi:hypothetical protein ACLB2K_001002 [Fragaria x ananassa]
MVEALKAHLKPNRIIVLRGKWNERIKPRISEFIHSLLQLQRCNNNGSQTPPFPRFKTGSTTQPRPRQTYISSDGGSSTSPDTTDSNSAPTPTDTVGIRFKKRSRKKAKQQREQREGEGSDERFMKAEAAVPKKWEEMSLGEQALELYLGEKGLLYWINKFAYASIFIVIGAWILFRFVGPALNLYQLDSAPLSPSAILKGS